MQFVKMNGAGNDFIILDALREPLPMQSLSRLAKTLCDRRRSIGADGMMVVVPATGDADYRMLFFNSDGSPGEMCGNGARCICRYGHDAGYAGDVQRVQTPSGIVTGQRLSKREYRIRMTLPTVVKRGMTLEGNGKTLVCDYVELGNPGLPHAVVELPEFPAMDEEDLRRLGKALRHHPAFPKGANVNFYVCQPDGSILEKTYERGVEDFTLACGTGTCSVVSCLTLANRTDGKHVRVQMDGGTLYVDAAMENGSMTELLLTGPTNLVARGEVLDEEWKEQNKEENP